MRISASNIAAWKYCPRSFYYEKIEGKVKPIGENLIKGTLIHVIYENFFKRRLFDDPKYFEWFITKGIDRMLEKEADRISKLKINKENLREFLLQRTNGLKEAYEKGLITMPTMTEHKIEIPEFIAKADAMYDTKDGTSISDVKIRVRDLDSVKLQLAVAAIILEKKGRKVNKCFAIDSEEWKELEVEVDEDTKKEVWDIREKIIHMYKSKEKPECACGRCVLFED